MYYIKFLLKLEQQFYNNAVMVYRYGYLLGFL